MNESKDHLQATDERVNASFEDTLKDLDNAEDGLLRVIQIATETCHCLQDLPVCDYEKIGKLSSEYNEQLQSVYSLIAKHLKILELEPKIKKKIDITGDLELLDKWSEELATELNDFSNEF
jgi:hypothetical protein